MWLKLMFVEAPRSSHPYPDSMAHCPLTNIKIHAVHGQSRKAAMISIVGTSIYKQWSLPSDGEKCPRPNVILSRLLARKEQPPLPPSLPPSLPLSLSLSLSCQFPSVH